LQVAPAGFTKPASVYRPGRSVSVLLITAAVVGTVNGVMVMGPLGALEVDLVVVEDEPLAMPPLWQVDAARQVSANSSHMKAEKRMTHHIPTTEPSCTGLQFGGVGKCCKDLAGGILTEPSPAVEEGGVHPGELAVADSEGAGDAALRTDGAKGYEGRARIHRDDRASDNQLTQTPPDVWRLRRSWAKAAGIDGSGAPLSAKSTGLMSGMAPARATTEKDAAASAAAWIAQTMLEVPGKNGNPRVVH
ncbi:hypothetical protein CT0861_10804, partial [Colletotrichum tofieldiae]